jgi:hypothetical protein
MSATGEGDAGWVRAGGSIKSNAGQSRTLSRCGYPSGCRRDVATAANRGGTGARGGCLRANGWLGLKGHARTWVVDDGQ